MKRLSVIALSVVTLSACNSDDPSSSSDETMFSLSVSDSPVDEAASVLVCFDSVELVGNGLQPQTFNVGEGNTVEANDLCLDETGNVIPNSFGVDLLTLQGETSASLIQNAPIPPGEYGQLRLNFMSEGSYVELKDGTRQGINIPSNQLRLDGVTLTANQTFNYTLEFDLRRALVTPPGLPNFLIQPRGLRLVNNAQVGHIDGSVSETLLINNDACTVAPEDATIPVGAVYLYQGHDIATADMVDNSDEDSPYASSSVFFDEAASYPFKIGYISQGDYTVGFTCDTNDDPESVDDISFVHAENVTINEGDTLELVVGGE